MSPVSRATVTVKAERPAAGRPSLRRAGFGGVALLAGVALAACSSGGSTASGGSSSSSNPLAPSAAKGTVVVGSANFPENELLAEIYVLALQAKGVKVTSKFNIGAREVYYPEVKSGAISIIPEYNGALLTTSVDTNSTAATTTEVDSALKAKLPSTLEILNPSSAQDKDSVTVTQATATKDHLTSIADLKPYAASMVIGGPPEFKTRTDGLVGLKKNYGLTSSPSTRWTSPARSPWPRSPAGRSRRPTCSPPRRRSSPTTWWRWPTPSSTSPRRTSCRWSTRRR